MRYCSNCGSPMSDTSKFCSSCGTKFEVFVPPVQPQSAQPQYQPQQQWYQPPYQQPVAPQPPIRNTQPARPFIEGRSESQSKDTYQFGASLKAIFLFVVMLSISIGVTFWAVAVIDDIPRRYGSTFLGLSLSFWRNFLILMAVLSVASTVYRCYLISRCYIVVEKDRIYGVCLPKRFPFSTIYYSLKYDDIDTSEARSFDRLILKPYGRKECVFYVTNADSANNKIHGFARRAGN